MTNNGTAPAARLGNLDQNSENIIAAGDSENFIAAGDRVAITTVPVPALTRPSADIVATAADDPGLPLHHNCGERPRWGG